ncbi:MAG: hypothetical protein ACI9U2_000476 [Bradymonadia bacterium]|jgi:hypothetical protein
MLRWTLPATLALFLGGCPGFGDKTLAEIEGITGVPTYETDIKPVLARYCTTCHTDPPVAGAPQPLLTYAQVLDDADRIHVRCVQLGDMPPGGGIPDNERALIDAWVLGGKPQGTPGEPEPSPDMGGEPEPGPDMGDTAPTWATVDSLLTAGSCNAPGCHGDAAPSAQLDLSSYAGFIAGGTNGDLTGGGDPALSLLIDRLRARNGNSIMPLGGPERPAAEIAIYEAWIAAGFPEE